MTDTATFDTTVNTAADRITKLLARESELTSWELKTKLQISSSLLYLALGALLGQGKVRLVPDQLNYRVSLLRQ